MKYPGCGYAGLNLVTKNFSYAYQGGAIHNKLKLAEQEAICRTPAYA